jgi:peptidoglycan hydrolase-like protein with peptidoglycan-binding domain
VKEPDREYLTDTLTVDSNQTGQTVLLQQRLNELGYVGLNGQSLDVNGKIDENTLQAVNEFKNVSNLWNTGEYEGKVGNTTWNLLFSDNATKGFGAWLSYDPTAAANGKTAELQQRLNDLGYIGSNGKALSVDGNFDENTQYAVNQFKNKSQLGNTGNFEGKVGSQTWEVLMSDGAIRNQNYGSGGHTSGSAIEGTGKDGDKNPIGSTSDFKKKYGDTINQMAKELSVDPNMLAAVILVESGGSGFVDGNLKIRFENHYFLDRTKDYADLFTYYWKDHKFRTSTDDEWRAVHTGKQSSEYATFNFAKSLSEEAAYQSISMGLGQIMGANFKATGHGSAKEMYEDFSKGHEQQIKGMATFFKNYNKGSTLRALQNGDLATFVSQYNGDGQVSTYTKLMNQRMEDYKNAQ